MTDSQRRLPLCDAMGCAASRRLCLSASAHRIDRGCRLLRRIAARATRGVIPLLCATMCRPRRDRSTWCGCQLNRRPLTVRCCSAPPSASVSASAFPALPLLSTFHSLAAMSWFRKKEEVAPPLPASLASSESYGVPVAAGPSAAVQQMTDNFVAYTEQLNA